MTLKVFGRKLAGFLLMAVGGIGTAVFALIFASLWSSNRGIGVLIATAAISALELGLPTILRRLFRLTIEGYFVWVISAVLVSVLFLVFVVLKVPLVSANLEEPVAAVISGVAGVTFCYVGYWLFRYRDIQETVDYHHE
jgi:hypothetical protein